jgi:hypothetical protein
MGKKLLDATAHDNLLIAQRSLVSAIQKSSLTGVEIRPARRRSREEHDRDFFWLQIDSEWPAMAPSRVLAIEDPCCTCTRSGHFDSHERVTEFHYAAEPQQAQDIAHTWEYFGVWRGPESSGRRPVGGGRQIIVSQRARKLFKEVAVKRISYDPVVLVGGAS